MKSVFHALARAARENEPVALGIISGVKGSSPQKTGAKALFYADGRIESTLGGGCLEAEIQQRAIRSLQTNEPAKFELLLDHDFGWDDGLICGGKVFGLILPNAQRAGEKFWEELAARKVEMCWGVDENFVFFRGSKGGDQTPWAKHQTPNTKHQTSGSSEDHYIGADLYEEVVSPPCHLWIAGAGHIAQAVAPLALQVDFEVSVFDDRPALANHRFFPSEVRLYADDWGKLLAHPLPSVPTFGLIVTRGHRHDALVLRRWIKERFTFLGMIGSARKARIIFDHFLAEKIATEEELRRVACPVGLDIGARTVPEIAMSIMAQMVQRRAGAFISLHQTSKVTGS